MFASTDYDTELAAKLLAPAWLNTQLAAGTDNDVQVLYRTVFIQHYEYLGVRLVSTDTHRIHWTWVPMVFADDTMPDELADEPALDAEPTWQVVAGDNDGRAKALFTWLHGAAKKDETLWRKVRLSIRDAEDPAKPILFPEENRRVLVIDADVEQVTLPIRADLFPGWHIVVLDGRAKKARRLDRIALDPGYLADLGKVHGGLALQFPRFTGPMDAAEFHMHAGDRVALRGVLMPRRFEVPAVVDHDDEDDTAGDFLRNGVGFFTGATVDKTGSTTTVTIDLDQAQI